MKVTMRRLYILILILDLSRYYNMAVIKDSKDRKFSLPPKPADIFMKSNSSTMTHLLSPIYSTDVESLNTPTSYASHSNVLFNKFYYFFKELKWFFFIIWFFVKGPSRTVSSTTCAVSPSSTIVDETFEPNFLLRENENMESYQSMMSRRQRGEKRPIPNEQKDEKYFERRKRNNEAAKKSRDARKIREDRVSL